ncbi:hypothetical protein TrST_g5731 [Triparma strigata]|uniref:MgtC/SapB/SrpB/YhiD N-terminal domain-containing protein n=1 Tax=Triparma strigata TaxID=1606541 RepID=A0A9W6ZGN0_9STRA|nr:hypothetical protein TrST_g5731 [Triparma strigata]
MPFIAKATYDRSDRSRDGKTKSFSSLLYGKKTPALIRVSLLALYFSLVLYTFIIVFVDPFFDFSGDCETKDDGKVYSNPDYVANNCLWERRSELFYLSSMECELTRRLLMSVLLGAAIGWERRDSDRPAGIRTMSLVSLGACLFTLTSMFSFLSGPMSWDASRVAAAIPSGVGFLGAGLIWKGSVGTGDNEVHQVHGLTTAASVWLSAAVGVGAGGGLYFICVYAVALIIMVLRFGPRMYGSEDSSVNHSEEEETDAWDTDSSAGLATGGGKKKSYSIDDHNPDSEDGELEVDEENGNAFATSQTMYGAIGSESGSVGVGSGEGVSLLRDQGGGVKIVSAGDGEGDGKGSTLSLLHEQGGGVKIIQDISGDGSGDRIGSKGKSSLQRRRSSKKKKAAMSKGPSFSS